MKFHLIKTSSILYEASLFVKSDLEFIVKAIPGVEKDLEMN